MENVQDFLDFHAENNNGMTREEFTAYYLSEKKEQKIKYLSLGYNERNGKLYKVTVKYIDGAEQRLRNEDAKFIEDIIKKTYGLTVDVSDVDTISKHEKELFKLSKKLKIDFSIIDFDLS